MLVYGFTSTIAVYSLYSEALVIFRNAIAISKFIIASPKTPALVKPPLDILYHYTI